MDEFYTSSESERRQLLNECHSLVDRIGRHAYSVKLLIVTKKSLLMIAKYKQKRA